MIEAYEVRQALEEKAVELIIKNASEKDIDELEEALQHLRKKYEETGRTSGEFELHRLYAAKTGSTFMTQTLEIVLNAIFDMMYGKFTDVLDATCRGRVRIPWNDYSGNTGAGCGKGKKAYG